jgi:hypothetical protein
MSYKGLDSSKKETDEIKHIEKGLVGIASKYEGEEEHKIN